MNSLKTKVLLISVGFFSISHLVQAGDQIGTLTLIEGDVKLFTQPSKSLQADPHGSPRALFEGEYYVVRDAKAGDPVEKGNIVRTSPSAKARVIYPNGDQFNVGASTAYRVSWNEDSANGKTQVQLDYGKLRGIIEKGGPRSRLQIRTRTAVMGVRGTDFYISQTGNHLETTEISIIRGEVEVKSKKSTSPQVASIKAGYSAAIDPVQPQIEIQKTNQDALREIHAASTLNVKVRDLASTNTETRQKVEKLEEKATQTALKDIQLHDQALYTTLQNTPNSYLTPEQINQAAVQNLIKDAPKAPAKRKPSMNELKDREGGAYERYFKSTD